MPKRMMLLLLVLLLCAGFAAAEESFAPDDFSFSGGTGRVVISCPEIRISGKETTAELVFDSPRYTCVRIGDTEYPTLCGEHTSRVWVPVVLNRAFEIRAVTTAMSVPHEIAYTLFIRVDALAGDALPGLKWQSSLPLRYAEGFHVDFYEGGYALLTIGGKERYLVLPRGMEAPEGTDPEITVLRRAPERIYLAATSAMSLFDALGGLDHIRFSSIRQEDWSVAAAAEAMARGDILFAGKYDKPDYERLVREGCDLAIESTMISHAPKIRELLELLGIPVLIDRSSYEPHPLGRTEWIRLYGVLLGREEEAERFFAQQADSLEEYEQTGKTAAFFYINTSGMAVVRDPSDYIPRMIAMAGGVYALRDLSTDAQSASVTVSMEDFYTMAADADYLIYNAAIDSSVGSMRDLTGKNTLLSEFRAVREGNVWLAEKNLYQATDHAADFIRDVHWILTGGTGVLTFLRPLK